jgi:Lrp/AsnC family transcriptional regulator, regulator for asnA, asnC and gidA
LDAKIIKYLLVDSRIPYDELAQHCQTTKNAVWKRCRLLERKGVIKGATTQINVNLMGFDAMATLLIKANPQQIQQTMELIKKVCDINVYQQYNSIYNVRAVAVLTDLNELDQLKQLIRERLPTLAFRTYIWMGTRTIPENLNLPGASINKTHNEEYKKSMPPTRLVVDELDRKIIRYLTVDGHRSFSDIAEDLKVSNHTIIKHYNRLRGNGVLKVLVQINLNKIGYVAILDLNIAFTSIRGLSINIVDLLAKIPDVIVITKTSGDFDLQISAVVKDLEQAINIQEEVSKIDGVTQIEANMRKIPDKWPTPQEQISTI